jgi:hypothetical protein
MGNVGSCALVARGEKAAGVLFLAIDADRSPIAADR